jgi:hypothetical protein
VSDGRRGRGLLSILGLAVAAIAISAGIYGGLALSGSGKPTANSGYVRGRGSPFVPPMAGKVEAPSPRAVYWGVFAEGAPASMARLDTIETTVGKTPAIVMWYQAWDNEAPFPADLAERLRSDGIVPMITWEPWKAPIGSALKVVDQPAYRLARIAGGAYDDYIRAYADAVRAYGGPLMLRPFHEMDGFWYPWGGTVNGNTPRVFVAACRHVHRIFDEEGATNVTWVWSVNAESVPASPINTPANYWPGSRYVDWIGISGFNWGASASFGGWKTFDEIYRNRIHELAHYQKPIVASEIGAPEVGGDKAAWIRQTLMGLGDRYPQVSAFVWYDKRDSSLQDWRITSSHAATTAFRESLATPLLLSAPAAARSSMPGTDVRSH